MCTAVNIIISPTRLLDDLKATPKPRPIVLGVDNNVAIETAKKASVNQRIKHIDLQCDFMRDAYKSNLISLRHVDSENLIVDSLKNY